MNSLLVKALLSLSLLGQAPVEPIIISIDRYVTPTQDSIYLVAEDHINSPVLRRQEQADFMAAMKKKDNAFVIVEDPTDCSGHNYQVKQLLEELFQIAADEVDPNSHEIVQGGSLRHFIERSKSQGIPAFNAECRQEIEYAKYYGGTEMAYDNVVIDLVPRMRDLKLYNIDWLSEYWREHIKVKKNKMHYIRSLKTSKFGSKLTKNNDFTTKAIDIRVLHMLHAVMHKNAQLPQGETNVVLKINSRDKKNIFIFAGFKHIYRIIPTLGRHFGYMKSSIDEEDRFSHTRFFIDELYEGQQNQEFIDKYKVNITDFFALEKEQESALLGCE